MFCTNCGAQLRDGAKFCDKCGTALQNAAQIPQPIPEPVQPAPAPAFAPVQEPVQPTPAPAFAPVQEPVQPTPAEVPQKPKKKKSPIAIAAVICLVLIAALVIGMLSPAIFGKETVYVMTKQSRFDKDGIETYRYEYEYDEYAQLLQKDIYFIEMREMYDAELDAGYLGYDEKSEMLLAHTYRYEYDDNGNTILRASEASEDYRYLYETNNKREYEYNYADGVIEEYTLRYTYGESENETDYTVSTEDGLMTKIVLETEDYTRIYAEYEYDDEGRLTQEFSFRPDLSFLYEYEYDGDLLTQVKRNYGMAATTTSGKLDAEWFGSIIFDLEYDDKDRLIQILAEDSDGEKLWKRAYEYDSKGHPTEMKITTYTDEGADVYTEEYTCDKHGNIIAVETNNGIRVEYEYEKLRVTKQQAASYRQYLWRDEDAANIITSTQFWNCNPCYNQIPNPMCNLKWAYHFLRTV